MRHYSFIVCSRNRCAQLGRTLQSIAEAVEACPQDRFDLVVVDNGSTDDTAKVFEDWARSAPLAAKRIFVLQPGLGGCRNAGIEASSGEVVIFTDDDCVLSRTYCLELSAHLDANPEPRILGGRVELGQENDLPFTIKLDNVGSKLGGHTHPGGFILGCNMVIPRSVLKQIGGFDGRFGAGARYRSGEETDLFYRAHRMGIAVEFVPDMAVYHFHGRSSVEAVRKLNYAYHYGTGALYGKYFFSDPGFSKHIYWAFRNALRETRGGSSFQPDCNLSYWSVVEGNLAGIFTFAVDRVRDRVKTIFSSWRSPGPGHAG